MNTLWTHFRRLITSVMLVAMTSFVLHSGALAGMHPMEFVAVIENHTDA